MVKFLDHINAQEEQWLREQSAQESYGPGDVILSEGEERHALFLIRSGVVRVELEHPEFNIEIARLNTGEIFGEMSFLQGFSVTANVIANDKVEVDVVNADVIDELIAKDEGFFGRFYQSLAHILCTRLRDTTLRRLLAETGWQVARM